MPELDLEQSECKVYDLIPGDYFYIGGLLYLIDKVTTVGFVTKLYSICQENGNQTGAVISFPNISNFERYRVKVKR